MWCEVHGVVSPAIVSADVHSTICRVEERAVGRERRGGGGVRSLVDFERDVYRVVVLVPRGSCAYERIVEASLGVFEVEHIVVTDLRERVEAPVVVVPRTALECAARDVAPLARDEAERKRAR